jgi:hypothetical protein
VVFGASPRAGGKSFGEGPEGVHITERCGRPIDAQLQYPLQILQRPAST